MKRNTSADRFKALCTTCRHFHCVKQQGLIKYCTYKGRAVGNGLKCSKFKNAQKILDL